MCNEKYICSCFEAVENTQTRSKSLYLHIARKVLMMKRKKEEYVMKEAVLLVFVLLCAMWDIRTFRIPNALILAGAAAAVPVRLLLDGRGCTADMAAGALAPLLVCFLLFYFSMLGAADIKMLMVIGIIAGGRDILTIMWYSLLIAAGFALIRIRKYRLIFLRSGYLAEFIRRAAAGGPKEAYISEKEIEDKSKWLMHLAVPIAAGCILWMLLKYI